MDADLLIGILGLLLILIAFALTLFGKLKQNSNVYCLFNFFGGIFLAYYAYALKVIPFFILQLIWAFFSLYKLSTFYIRR